MSLKMTPMREKLWLTFDGEIERTHDKAILRPRIDPRCYNVFALEEVRVIGDRVQVLKGAKVLDRYIVEDSVFAVSGDGFHEECGSRTRCFGRLEECCSNGEVVGPCAGEWGC